MRDLRRLCTLAVCTLQVRDGRVVLNGERRYEPYTPELATYEMAQMQARAII